MTIYFVDNPAGKIPILFLGSRVTKEQILREVIDKSDIAPENFAAMEIYLDPKAKKTKVKDIRFFITEEILPFCARKEVQHIVVANAEYFKAFTKVGKVEPALGTVYPCYGYNVIYCPSLSSIYYDPENVRNKIALAITALEAVFKNEYKPLGENIIEMEEYPNTAKEIESWINSFLEEGKANNNFKLACDIETFSLKHYEAGIVAISFAWSTHRGISFLVDDKITKKKNLAIRDILKRFFEKFEGKLIFHNAAFDISVLIYQLFMEDILDQKGLLEGLGVFKGRFDDTKLITYLATNSTARHGLGLKENTLEFSGNYAIEEIKNIQVLDTKELLKYNLIDSLSTMYLYNKYYQKMQDDKQESIYKQIFLPATIDIIQMQLTGMPLDMNKVKDVKQILISDMNRCLTIIKAKPEIKLVEKALNEEYLLKRNKKLKVKKLTLDDIPYQSFNINSPTQLQMLLYDICKFKKKKKTISGQAATDADTLESLKAQNKHLDLLQALIDYSAASKIITAFIPHFEEAIDGGDGRHYLFGNFNLGGTVSGRLSSSKPNLQQIPATGSKYAKLIKECFSAPAGWLFVGLDFASLEDRISALTTKDPNKLKVYTDNYDAHSFRAYSYFNSQMQEENKKIQAGEDPVKVINSIKENHPDLRQASKRVTFALTYQGTWNTLMEKCGFDKKEAQRIEAEYHKLYSVSDKWVQDQLQTAYSDGYITCAFGLRVRTPILKQTVIGKSRFIPKEAQAEARTAGNALGQSWCLLTTRAGIEFNEKARYSKYALDIKPCAQIHDAQYFLIRDNPIDLLIWVNDNLVKAVQWQEDPLIQHNQVHLGGELSVFYPNWAHEMVVPNSCTLDNLKEIANNYMETLYGNRS